MYRIRTDASMNAVSLLQVGSQNIGRDAANWKKNKKKKKTPLQISTPQCGSKLVLAGVNQKSGESNERSRESAYLRILMVLYFSVG
jgi:hypothetical protein